MTHRKPRSDAKKQKPYLAKISCPRCKQSISLTTNEVIDLNGSETVDCERCGAELEVEYKGSIAVTKVEVISAPPLEFNCPQCSEGIKIYDDVDSKTGSIEIDCDNCSASIEVSWSDWGRDANAELLEEPPRSPAKEKKRNVKKATVTSSQVEFECPECETEMSIDDIESESGTEEVECENQDCGAVLEVSWSDWGQDTEVKVLQESGEEDDDDDDDDDEEEDDEGSGRHHP